MRIQYRARSHISSALAALHPTTAKVLERLDDKELKAVIRELFSRIEVASLRLDDHKQACDAAMLRDVSSIAQLTAKQAGAACTCTVAGCGSLWYTAYTV